MPRAALVSATPLPSPAPSDPKPSPEAGSGADRRVHRRHAVEEMPTVSRVRLKYGPMIALIDISAGGAQIETTNFRLQPGSAVVLEITTEHGDVSAAATVLRCQLASLLPEPVYRGALVFKQEFDLGRLGVEPAESVASEQPLQGDLAAAPDPAAEVDHLRKAIRRLALAAEPGPTPDAVLAPMFDALAAAHASLDSPAGRRAGEELVEELAGLFQAMAVALEGTPTPAALGAAIEEHLRHVVPVRALYLLDPTTPGPTPGADAILLSVPRLSPEGPVVRLAVEFGTDVEPEELHLQILKAGALLVAIARELGRLHGMDRPLEARGPDPLPEGWSRVVVRYNSGATHEGYAGEFVADKGYLELRSEPVSSSKSLMVPFTDLRAVGFLKGDTAVAQPKGRRVTVTFKDGEQLAGTTESYRRSAPGFFVRPADPSSPHDRVFVVLSAAQDVQFG